VSALSDAFKAEASRRIDRRCGRSWCPLWAKPFVMRITCKRCASGWVGKGRSRLFVVVQCSKHKIPRFQERYTWPGPDGLRGSVPHIAVVQCRGASQGVIYEKPFLLTLCWVRVLQEHVVGNPATSEDEPEFHDTLSYTRRRATCVRELMAKCTRHEDLREAVLAAAYLGATDVQLFRLAKVARVK
jgi:hypothetical protein